MIARLTVLLALAVAGCTVSREPAKPPARPKIDRRGIRAWSERVVRFEFELPSETVIRKRSIGAGFLWDSRLVLSCRHTFEPVFPSLKRGAPVPWNTSVGSGKARLVAFSRSRDLALFRLDAPLRRVLPPPIAARPRLGAPVYAFGYPIPHILRDRQPTVTSGIVSGLNRTVRYGVETDVSGLLQIDAVASYGNSGGPVIDGAGSLLGLLILSATGSKAEWKGAAFAVPAQELARFVQEHTEGARPVPSFEGRKE